MRHKHIGENKVFKYGINQNILQNKFYEIGNNFNKLNHIRLESKWRTTSLLLLLFLQHHVFSSSHSSLLFFFIQDIVIYNASLL